MGQVIRFPDDAGSARGRYIDANSEPATVIILPVIRIERNTDDSGTENSDQRNGKRRRRRASR